MSKRRRDKKKDQYTPIPFTRPHSDLVRENRKERRRNAQKESKRKWDDDEY